MYRHAATGVPRGRLRFGRFFMSRLDRSALVAGCVSAALFFGIASASASTLLVANTSNTLVSGNVYDTGSVVTAGNASISTDYYFTVPTTVSTIDQMATFHSDASNNIGIANAVLSIFAGGSVGSPAGGSPIATLLVSNSSGVDFSSTPTLLFNLLAGTYDFR